MKVPNPDFRLRKIGFSKDGKFQNPQIMLGLLVGENGCPIGPFAKALRRTGASNVKREKQKPQTAFV